MRKRNNTKTIMFKRKHFDMLMMKTIIERKLFWCNDEKNFLHIQEYYCINVEAHFQQKIFSIVER